MDLRRAIAKPRSVNLSEMILEGHPEQIAMEGIIDTVAERFRNLFEKKEKEIYEEINHGDANLTQIQNVRAMIANKTTLREDPTTVKLGIYAKWISLNGDEVDDVEMMERELQRIADLADLFRSAYIPALIKLFNYISDVLLKSAVTDPVAAIDNYEESSPDFFPTAFKRILKKTRKGHLGNTVTDVLASDNYIGDWFVGATTDSTLTKARLDVGLHYDLAIKKNKEAYLQPYSKDEIEKLLVVIGHIAQTTIDINKDPQMAKALEKIYFEMSNLEKKYKNWDSHGKRSPQEKAVYDCMMLAYTALYESNELLDACTVFDHICKIVLKICEHSSRRMI